MKDINKYKCPNCSGQLELISEINKYRCPYCDGVYDASIFDSPDYEPINKTHTTGSSNNNVVTFEKTGTRELERSGNIGVTTSQQMLESEIEVRKHDIYMIIYNDIDTILTNMKWG